MKTNKFVLFLGVAAMGLRAQSFETPALPFVFDVGQASVVAETPSAPPAPAAADTKQVNRDGTLDKRIYGVLPNYRIADGTQPFVAISAKQKMMIGVKDSFDYPAYFLAGMFAGLNQLTDSNPEFGQGLKGYAKRYGAGYADQAIGNLMTESLFPVMFHQDPRYFRVGKSGGTVMARTGYALSRIFVCHNDKGGSAFNISELGGNATATAIGNLYYSSSTRNPTDNAIKWGTAVATDAISNILKEFWPDVKEKFVKKTKD